MPSTRKIILFLVLIAASCTLEAQTRYTISGYVKDAANGETLPGTSIVVEGTTQGITSNAYGYYSLPLPTGTYTLLVQFLGYETRRFEVVLDKNVQLNIALKVQVIETGPIEIVADRKDNTQSSQMGMQKLEMEQVRELPVLFGEVDILKTLQLLPGVSSAGEGNSGFYVRGGGPDQNLLLLDEAVVYNSGHLLGFFSVFNADAVSNTTLIKGGMPARYGGRLSSVVDVQMKEGNLQQYQARGGIGLISSRLTVEGPLEKDKSAFIFSGRRTYIDVLTKPFTRGNETAQNSGYYFYDLNAKTNYRFNDKNRLFLSGYLGKDVFGYYNPNQDFSFRFPYGNRTGTLRWNHVYGPRLFANHSLIASHYDFNFEGEQATFTFNLFSGITDYTLKSDYDWVPHVNHKIQFGYQAIRHQFVPSTASGRSDTVVFAPERENKQHAWEGALYISDDMDLSTRVRLHLGLRYSGFVQVGPYDLYRVSPEGVPTDTVHYSSGERIAQYGGPEPRVALRYLLDPDNSLKASFTRNLQYVHLATYGSGNLPTDVWIPSSTLVQPQDGYQYALGYFRNFNQDRYETSVEVYYKDLDHLIEFSETSTPQLNANVENELEFGTGQSYGAELFVKKKYGKLNGWLGYTWSKTTRDFDNINGGQRFYARFDRRHDASAVVQYPLGRFFKASLVFVYGSGATILVPDRMYLIQGAPAFDYSPGYRDRYRFEPYHRADFSITYDRQKTRRIQSSWNFSLYNLYNRKNAFVVYMAPEGNVQSGEVETRLIKVSVFPIIPSITWNYRF